ncbi:MAG TPA: MoxR family ATPase [Methanoregulaceae archaeon]|nr:MoxR family ATPase [Methanoregulaceae archaeon]HPD76239.1 MoxR family ATPase [Methanoregulaceae archaeon]
MKPHAPETGTIPEVARFHDSITRTLGSLIVGNRELIELIIIALLAEGHILIEGVPGTAKTTIAKAVARATNCQFNRIQGAVDLQPADLIGIKTYDTISRSFTLRKGPIFTNILLADEINRINPKSQGAFIEAMSEQQATIDGETCRIASPFLVIATQNPYDLHGTFPLIEAQRDRFMFGLTSGHLNSDEELDLVRRASVGKLDWDGYSRSVPLENTRENLLSLIRTVNTVRIEEPVLAYIRDIVIATRKNGNIELGASSRASVAFVRGAKAHAALTKRPFVLPDDVKVLADAILCHRIILTREAEVENIKPEDVVREILETIEVP